MNVYVKFLWFALKDTQFRRPGQIIEENLVNTLGVTFLKVGQNVNLRVF